MLKANNIPFDFDMGHYYKLVLADSLEEGIHGLIQWLTFSTCR